MTTIESWDPFNAEWKVYATYLDDEHAQQNLELLQKEHPHCRYRFRPPVEDIATEAVSAWMKREEKKL